MTKTDLASKLRVHNSDFTFCGKEDDNKPDDGCKPIPLCATSLTFKRSKKNPNDPIEINFEDGPANIKLCDKTGQLIIGGCDSHNCVKSCSGCSTFTNSHKSFIFDVKKSLFTAPRIKLTGGIKCDPTVDLTEVDQVVVRFKYSIPVQGQPTYPFLKWERKNPSTNENESILEVRTDDGVNYFDFINGVLAAQGIILHTPSETDPNGRNITTYIKGNAETDGSLVLNAHVIVSENNTFSYRFVLDPVI